MDARDCEVIEANVALSVATNRYCSFEDIYAEFEKLSFVADETFYRYFGKNCTKNELELLGNAFHSAVCLRYFAHFVTV